MDDQRWLNTSTGTELDRFQYGYDRDGNVLYKNNLVNSADSELYHANGSGYGYDSLNQLTAFARGTLSDSNSDGIPDTISSPSASEAWSYDALGNMTSVTTNGGTPQSRTFNQQNQLTLAGSNTLGYDAAGEMTTDEAGQTYTYNAWGQVTQVKNSGGTTLGGYGYDALNRRVSTAESGTTTDLFYSAKWQVVEEQVGGTPKAQYVWGEGYVDALVERDRDANGLSSDGLEERLYAQQDGNWNTTALVNTSGAAVERYLEDPYGVASYLTPSWAALTASAYAWVYNHQGGRLDTVTGDYNWRNREERPTIARWNRDDPTGFNAGDSNLYRYVYNQPLGHTDSTGLDPIPTPSWRLIRPVRPPVSIGLPIPAPVPAGKVPAPIQRFFQQVADALSAEGHPTLSEILNGDARLADVLSRIRSNHQMPFFSPPVFRALIPPVPDPPRSLRDSIPTRIIPAPHEIYRTQRYLTELERAFSEWSRAHEALNEDEFPVFPGLGWQLFSPGMFQWLLCQPFRLALSLQTPPDGLQVDPMLRDDPWRGSRDRPWEDFGGGTTSLHSTVITDSTYPFYTLSPGTRRYIVEFGLYIRTDLSRRGGTTYLGPGFEFRWQNPFGR